MIELRHLTKKYGNRTLFEDLNLIFYDIGLVSIIGNSGCGKSTLLNLMSTLDTDYEGDIIIDGTNLKTLNDNQLKDLRINKFGYIFQSYNLFENETVFNNIKLVQFKEKGADESILDEEIFELLKRLEIYDIQDQLVKFLSGGEKQRVAIARALINKPSIIFCDEPTGSVDENNAIEIFKILQEISKESLVVVVTHDMNLADQFSNYEFSLATKEMRINKKINFKDHKNKSKKKEGKIGFKYIFRSIKSTMKSRKMRYLISSMMFSLSLICLGLTIFVSDNISRSISKAFSNLISDNSLILRKQGDASPPQIVALKEDETREIYEKYKGEIEMFGTKFVVDFKEFFPETNNFYYEKNSQLHNFFPLTARKINDFVYINDELFNSEVFYPRIQEKLKNDEIIISLDYQNMEKLCLNLRIERSYESLGKYLENSPLKFVLKTRNDYWNYKDEQVFYLKAVIIRPSVQIFHTNNLFNQKVFKDFMRFPVSNNVFKTHDLPWVMNQFYYIKSKKFPSELLNKIQYDSEFSNIIFEPDNSTFSPDLCIDDELCYSNRTILLRSLNDIFKSSIIKQVKSIDKRFSNYYFSTPGGYMNYGGSMFNGFSKEMYFSLDKEKLKNIENVLQQVKISEYESARFNDKVAKGYALDTNQDNVRFSIKYDGEYTGFKDLSLNNIVISSALAKRLGKENIVGKELFLMINYETNMDQKYYFKKFKIAKFIVGGIVESNAFKIYQSKDFSISLFRDFFQISSLELIPDSIVYEFDKKPSKKDIQFVNEHIKDYEVIDPFESIDNSMDEIFYYFDIGLLIFTIFTCVSTLLLMFVINAINFEDDKKEIAIYQMLGFKNSEINKTQLCKNFSYTLPSLFSSIISIILVSIILGKVFEKILGFDIGYSFPYYSIFGIVILTIFMTLISYFFVTKYIKKAKLVDELHKMT